MELSAAYRQAPTLHDLPDDSCRQILRQLDTATRVQVGQVDRRWRRLARDCFVAPQDGLAAMARRGDALALRKALRDPHIETTTQIDQRDTNGMTPLMWAACSGSLWGVRVLIGHGAKPQRRDHCGLTALDWARWFFLRDHPVVNYFTKDQAMRGSHLPSLTDAILAGHTVCIARHQNPMNWGLDKLRAAMQAAA